MARKLDGVRGPVQVNGPIVVRELQSWQYTRAESDHRNDQQPKKVYRESPAALSAGSVYVSDLFSELKSEL
jgi:hypothetical protein